MEELELCGQGETRCELLYLNVRIVIWQGSGQQGVLCLRLGGGRVVQMLALVLEPDQSSSGDLPGMPTAGAGALEMHVLRISLL